MLATTEAIGDCDACHTSPSMLFDRPILVDPFDLDGDPVYETVEEITGVEKP